MQSNKSNSQPVYLVISYYLAALVLLTIGIRYALPLRDSDIWFHLIYGRYFIDNLTLIPDHTIFSWTPTTNDAIYCTWLSDIFLYLLYSLGDLPVLFIFRYACMLFFVLAVALYAKHLKLLRHPITWLVCLIGVLMSYVAAYCKPEIITYVFMTAITWNWWHIKSCVSASWKNCYLFPLITIIWVNSHGGVIFGFVFLAMIGASELLNIWFGQPSLSTRTRKHLYIALVLSIATLLCNPYGWHYPLSLIQNLLPTAENLAFNSTVSAGHSPYTMETQKLDYGNLANLGLFILLLAAIPLIKNRKLEASFLLTNLVFAFLFSFSFRTTFYWAPVLTFSLLYTFSQKQGVFFPKRKIYKVLLTLIILTTSTFLTYRSCYDAIYRPAGFLSFGFGKGEFSPFAEAAYIKKNYRDIKNISNTYNQGAYLMWELWPEQKVMIDARHFPYKAWSNDYFKFLVNPATSDFMDRFPSDIWCVSLGDTILHRWLFQSPEWNLAFYGKNSAVFVRRPLPVHAVSDQELRNSVLSIKGPTAAMQMFSFALFAKDWSRLAMIIDRMREIRWWPKHGNVPEAASLTMKAYQAYYKQNYQEVVEAYSHEVTSDLHTNKTMLSYSYLFLGAKAWAQKDDAQALEMFQMAWETEKSIYTLYNSAMISGYMAKNPENKQLVDPQWKDALKRFLEMSGEFKNNEQLLTTVQAMISGEYEDRPPLLMPKKEH